MSRDLGKRVEVTLALKGGSSIVAIDEIEESLTADVLADYAKQLTRDVAEGKPRSFADGFGTSGQHTWVNLGEVVAFSLRPSK